MFDLDHVEKTLQNYIGQTLLDGTPVSIEDELLLSGLLDSLGVMSLVTFIEEQFNCAVPFEDVLIENFSSVSAIAAYLETKLNAGA